MNALNPQQQAAVTAPDGPNLVLAGAGSGKTTVIVERLVWLAEEHGVDPRHLLALTFTNKAAGEMRLRFAARLGLERVPAYLGTFHSFGLYLLRRDIERLGYKRDFTVFDDTDQRALLKKLVQELPDHLKTLTPREALWRMSEYKQRCARPGEDEDEALRVVWNRYHEILQRTASVDFDDLLLLSVRLLEEHPEASERWQRRYKQVLIDEYQDTNHAQYRLARALAAGHGNLFAVGDEDQGIYAWRGADIRNILDFGEDFPEANIFKLEVNYRSTQAILDVANAVVANNRERLGKTLRAHQPGGEKVRLFDAEDGRDEARFVVDDIVKSGAELNQVAVLYRTNAQARELEEALRTRGLHYVVVGGVKFYSRKEVKDLLAYLRLLVVPEDDVALRRVINVPARGIGASTLQTLEAYATARKCPLFQVCREVDQDQSLSPRARTAIFNFVHLIDELALAAREGGIAPLLEQVIEKVGYRTYVEHSDERDFVDRLSIVDEFVNSCQEWDDNQGGSLLVFLQDLALLTDLDTQMGPGAPAVTLMTCHSAKGLEFDHVYLVGLEEELFPLTREDDADYEANLEEERRLAYVAMTRARKRLTLCWSRARTVYGRTSAGRRPSRFIHEAGSDRLERLRAQPPAGGPRSAAPSAHVAAADPNGFKVGTRVRHAKFGVGTVMYTSGAGSKMRVRVRFKTGPARMLVVAHAPLEIVDGR